VDFLYTRPGEAESILVNGNGFPALLDNEIDATMPPQEALNASSTSCGPEIIQVEPNKTYRFRAIGGVAMSPFVFAFEDHDNLTVIAADAGYTQPASTDFIHMGAGQRYDFLLHTKTEEELQSLGKTEFWVPIETRYRELNDTFYAVLSYTTPGIHINTTTDMSSPPAQSPVYIPYDCQDWLEYTLEPLTPNDFPTADEVTRQVFMTSAQLNTASGSFWTINNRTWDELNQHEGDTPYNDTSLTHDAPYLVSVYQQGERAIPNYGNAVQNYSGWDPELNVYPAKIGEIIDIILCNEPNGIVGGFDTHPWHFHGAHFYDLGSGPGSYNATANEERLKGYNPIVRDTSFLFKYTNGYDAGLNYTIQGWRAWRVKVTDPG
jgi:L-ascorbate oxidase